MNTKLKSYTIVATYTVPYAESLEDALYQFIGYDGQYHLEDIACYPTGECQCGDLDTCLECFTRRNTE